MVVSREIQEVVVDGVPVLLSDRSSGRCHAALMVRTGVVDELLHRRGITHLVEHLALSTLGDRVYDYNGFVDGARTVFVCEGTPEQVSEFLTSTCRALSDLPAQRVAQEKRVLLAEAAGRESNLASQALAMRYGPNGYGLLGYDELFLHHPDVDPVPAWATERFHRDHAVVWIAGGSPSDLSLPLGAGPTAPLTETASPVIPLPSWLPVNPPGAMVSMIVERSVAALALARHLDRRVKEHLRHEHALSYAPSAVYWPLDHNYAHLTVAAAALPEHAETACIELLRVVSDVATNGVAEAELVLDIARARQQMEHPDSHLGRLDARAVATLFGQPSPDDAEMLSQLEALDATTLATLLQGGLAEALYLLGGAAMPADWGVEQINDWSWNTHLGRVLKPMIRKSGPTYPPPRSALVVGDDGLTLQTPQGHLSVNYDDTRALLQWHDGPYQLISANGLTLMVDPGDWDGGQHITRALDAHIRDQLRIPMGPSPGPAPRRRHAYATWLLWVTMVMATALLGLTVGVPLFDGETRQEIGTVGAVVIPLVMAAVLMLILWRAALTLRERRHQPK